MTHAPDPVHRAAMLAKAETLVEALPYLQRYAGRTFVVKYGGHAMGDPELARDFAEDVVLLKAVGINPVVVHGGGPQIGAMLKKLGVESQFVDGLRVTDKQTAQIAEMVLSGAINKELVGWIAGAGGKALGISGKDGGLVTATKVQRTAKDPDSHIERAIDLGFVGEPTTVDTTLIETASAAGMIPVIAPIAPGKDGETYNINADTMAGALAAALGAARLILLTDVAGVLDQDRNLLTDLTPADIAQLQADGTITGGMIPKLETCVLAVEAGCEAAVVLDGRVPHAMLLEVFTSRGAGTLIHKG
jgi:acetylglutamate kinase